MSARDRAADLIISGLIRVREALNSNQCQKYLQFYDWKRCQQVFAISSKLPIHPTELKRPEIVQNKFTPLATKINRRPGLTVCL